MSELNLEKYYKIIEYPVRVIRMNLDMNRPIIEDVAICERLTDHHTHNAQHLLATKAPNGKIIYEVRYFPDNQKKGVLFVAKLK